MGELTLRSPLDSVVISSPYGWRTLRTTGTRKFHYGTDFEAKIGTSVKASESGKVIRASGHEALGEVVIIDHVPKAENRRHIYTLYAHLSAYSVSQGDTVYRGDEIGLSGNTGHSTGPHLHFALIDSAGELGWNKSGSTGVSPTTALFKDPMYYIGRTLSVDGTIYDLTDEEKDKIAQRMAVDPHMDLERGIWWMDVTLGGKRVGRIDKHNKEIKLSLSPEEVEDILRQPPAPSKSKELTYSIRS